MMLPTPALLGPIWGISEMCLSVAKRSKGNAVSKDKNTLGWIWTINLAAVGLGMFLFFLLPSWRLPWWRPLYVAGLVLFAAGLFLRWYSIIYLGRFFTVNVAIAADHQLINTGPYRYVRHPSYSGSMTMLLGFAVCMQNVASIIVVIVPSVSVTLWRIRVEEEALLGAFGERYRAYMQRTKRLVPFVY
jgi:protein-S-isoprenylcysteine O-methyltransferase